MTDLRDPVSVTLRAGDWLILLGLLGRAERTAGNDIIDRIYDQLAAAEVIR